MNKISCKFDWEPNGTEVYPSGTFYLDTYFSFVGTNVYLERILRSQIRKGVPPLMLGMLSAWGGGKGLRMDLAQSELEIR